MRQSGLFDVWGFLAVVCGLIAFVAACIAIALSAMGQ